MIDPATSMGTPGQAKSSFKTLKEDMHAVDVLPQASGCLVVAQGKMDGWSLWRTSMARVVGETELFQVKYALSREGLFDAP